MRHSSYNDTRLSSVGLVIVEEYYYVRVKTLGLVVEVFVLGVGAAYLVVVD